MASTPLIRYYDHLRFVYEVQSRVRNAPHHPEQPGKRTQETTLGTRGIETRHLIAKTADPVSILRNSRGPTLLNDSVGLPGDIDFHTGIPGPRKFRRLVIPAACLIDKAAGDPQNTRYESKTGKEHSMDCVNHSGVPATAYCQNCGKAICATACATAPEARFSASRAGWHGRTSPSHLWRPPSEHQTRPPRRSWD